MSKIRDLSRFRIKTPSFGKNLLILIKIVLVSTKLPKILFKTIFKSSIDKGLCTPVPSMKFDGRIGRRTDGLTTVHKSHSLEGSLIVVCEVRKWRLMSSQHHRYPRFSLPYLLNIIPSEIICFNFPKSRRVHNGGLSLWSSSTSDVTVLTLRRATSETSTVGTGGMHMPPSRSRYWLVLQAGNLDQ